MGALLLLLLAFPDLLDDEGRKHWADSSCGSTSISSDHDAIKRSSWCNYSAPFLSSVTTQRRPVKLAAGSGGELLCEGSGGAQSEERGRQPVRRRVGSTTTRFGGYFSAIPAHEGEVDNRLRCGNEQQGKGRTKE